MTYDIRHDHVPQCFEKRVDDLLCMIDDELHELNLSLTHVLVPKPLEGRGIAGEVTRAALDWAPSKNHRVIPICPYVQAWLHRQPDYQNLVS